MSHHDVDPFAPATDLAARIRDGDLSPVAVVEAYLDEIDARDGEINAYVTVTGESARERAADAEAALEAGEDWGPLHGVPVALKDLRDLVEGVPHSFGSKLIGELGYAPDRTGANVQRLLDAGAIVLGKTNVPEFGHKGVTDNEYVGATASPVAPETNAGGSSGGSAAAVAAGMAPLATGSDSGGSIRIPAAASGVFGHKPSFGLIPVDSRPNAFGTKTHHTVNGPLTRTVEDAALLMEVLVGPHPVDPATVPDPGIDWRGALDRGVEDLRVGYSPDLEAFPVEEEVADEVAGTVRALESAGATVEEVTVDHGHSLPELADAIETTFAASVVGVAEVLEASFGIDLRDYPDQVSDSLLELLATGDEKTVPEVARTGIVRTDVYDAVEAVLAEYDLLVTPTTGEAGMDLHTDRGLEWPIALTWPLNWTGHPAASVPAGTTEEGYPVGTQVVGARYADDDVFAAAAAIERERPWHDVYPH